MRMTMHHAITDSADKVIRKFNSLVAANEFKAKLEKMHMKHSFYYQYNMKKGQASSMFKRDGSRYVTSERVKI